MASAQSPSVALRARQHRTAAQRLVRRAFFELSQARGAWAAATAAGRDAAAALVNARLSAEYAPRAPLPPAVTAQPGLAAAVARKLAQRAAAAAAELRAAVAGLRAAHAALDAALRTLSPTEVDSALDAAADAASGPSPPAARLGAIAPPRFDPEAFPDMVIYAALPLSALDAYAAEVVAMHAAELALKEKLAHALCALADGAAPVTVSRETLTLWLSLWQLAPLLHTQRLEEIDALIAEELQQP